MEEEKLYIFIARFLKPLILLIASSTAFSAQKYLMFVSFSMPEKLLIETARDAASHKITLIINGFYNDSMRETAIKIFDLSKQVPNLSMQIDPTEFERYGIKTVPALVSDNHQKFDVVFGNTAIDAALDEIKRFGDTKDDV